MKATGKLHITLPGATEPFDQAWYQGMAAGFDGLAARLAKQA